MIDLPLGYKSGYAATKLINAYYEKFKPKEFDETKVLYLHAHGPGILTTKKAVYKLEDLKGMKIRSTGSERENRAGTRCCPGRHADNRCL